MNLSEEFEQKNVSVTLNYFGSKYKGTVTNISEKDDGIFLEAVDPRMLRKRDSYEHFDIGGEG